MKWLTKRETSVYGVYNQCFPWFVLLSIMPYELVSNFTYFFYMSVKYTYYTPDRHQVLARDPSTTPFDLTSTIDFIIVLKLMLILTRTERTQLEPKVHPPGKLMKCDMSFLYHSMWYHKILTRNKRTHLVPQHIWQWRCGVPHVVRLPNHPLWYHKILTRNARNRRLAS